MAQFFNSSVVLPKYSKIWRLTSSISPTAFVVDTNPGMLSMIRRRLCSFAVISSVRFSAANRDSACDEVVVFGPCLDSDPTDCTPLAASLSCISWSGLRRDSGELIIFSILGPAYDPSRYDTTQGQCMLSK